MQSREKTNESQLKSVGVLAKNRTFEVGQVSKKKDTAYAVSAIQITLNKHANSFSFFVHVHN